MTISELLEVVLVLVSILGAAASVTYWGGRISRSVEAIAEQLMALRGDMQAHESRLDRHGERLEAHGQRIAVVETRQDG